MQHGGDLFDAINEFGGEAEAWLDLSTGINPTPWPIPPALLAKPLYRLPSRAAEQALLDAARTAYRIPPRAALVAAPGTQALIQWLPHLAYPGAVAIDRLTYNEHGRAWSHAGHRVLSVDSVDALPNDATHAVIVNPNNPDGRLLPRDAIAAVAATLKARGGWLVVDEAFVDVHPSATAADLCVELPIVLLRSFGKFYGLPGLRLGFAIGAPEIIAKLRDALGPWSVAGPALAIGEAALRDEAWADTMRRQLQHQADRLDRLLTAKDCAIVGGTTLFRLIRHPEAASLHARLAHHRIWSRKFPAHGDLLRLGLPRTDGDFTRLAAALA
ncbi:MAG: threonine-phosphate decarboxylase CobD [Xanthobacteraceae bacterium]